jgi:hypothetical protein
VIRWMPSAAVTALLGLSLMPVAARPLRRSDPSTGPDPAIERLLDRTGSAVVKMLDQLGDVKCTERVEQIKFAKNGRPEYQEDSTFDYLVLFQRAGGDVNLVESRHAGRQPEHHKKVPLLVTNGFSTLLLVFHPLYQSSYEFSSLDDQILDGRRYARLRFRHIQSTRTTAVLILRDREYPLDLQGTAWIDPETGQIGRIEAELAETMEDVGMKSLRSEVEYGPFRFTGLSQPYWLPSLATVDVETPRQHWRNVHRFTAYMRFSTSTDEHVGKKP